MTTTGPRTAAIPAPVSPTRPASLPEGALANLTAPSLLVDHEGVVVAVNSALTTALHRPAAELVGRDVHAALHRDDGLPSLRGHCRMREAVRAGETAHGGPDWFTCGDGTLLERSWSLTPYRVGPGAPGALAHLYEARPPTPPPDTGPAPLTELDRLTLLAEATTQLTSTLDVDEALRRLAGLTVPHLADWAVVDLLAAGDGVRRALVMTHRDGALVRRRDLEGPLPHASRDSPLPLARALRGAGSGLTGPGTYRGPQNGGVAAEQQHLFAETGMHTAAIAPVRGLRDVLGALTLGRSRQPDSFTHGDLPLLEDITRRAGLALDNARLYQRQRKVAETMQRHLLPQLPPVPGLEMTVRYQPAPHASYVGGDWYDVFPLADGTHALVIGDVVGHDLEAAAGMAQVRNMLRAFAWSRPGSPGAVLTQLDEALAHVVEVAMATSILARISIGEDERWRLHWTNAGHLPPLLVTEEGDARHLSDAHGILLGTGLTGPRPETVTVLPAGATVLLYTDGLVESRHHSLDDGLELLRRKAASLADRPLDSFVDVLLDEVRPRENDDDVAVLALRTPAAPG